MGSTDWKPVTDGIDLAWACCRSVRGRHDELPVPFSALVTLLTPIPHIQALPYAPSECRKCRCALNCYCRIDFSYGTWMCPLWCATPSKTLALTRAAPEATVGRPCGAHS
jgi:hypothetical protein